MNEKLVWLCPFSSLRGFEPLPWKAVTLQSEVAVKVPGPHSETTCKIKIKTQKTHNNKMWAPSSKPFAVVRDYTLQISRFRRQLRTQCTNFHPRGYKNRHTTEVSICEGIHDDKLTSKPTLVHSKDARTIDSIDPVVLKYTKIINDMRSKSNGVEVVNETHFGSIRFDQENIPHIHGLFDTEYNAIEASSGDNSTISEDEYTVDNSDTLKDEHICNDNLSSSSENLAEQLQFKTSTGRENCVMNKDLSYIDEVFFKNTLENLEINRQPVIDYSVMKKDLEKVFLSKEKPVTTSQEKEESGEELCGPVSRSNLEKKGIQGKNRLKEQSNPTQVTETPKSAFEYVVRMRHEEHKKQHGLASDDGSNKSYKKILSLVNEKTKTNYTRYEVMKSLKSGILYDDHDIVGLHKPYGIAMHGGSDCKHHILMEYLPELADYLQAQALYPVHRLDASTTGVVLFARTPTMANNLKRMFKDRQLKKIYWAITKAVPDPMQGIIDIPVAEGAIDGRRRMVLKPDVKGLKSTASSSKMAVTLYKVISKRDSAALVELTPMTGVKHQLRVHMSFGLTCPILGDHKYSHLKKMSPQALPGDMLDKLRMKQSKVRHLPLFLHSKSILIPEIVDGRNILIQAKIPAYFNKALSLLKLNRYESKVKLDEQMMSLS